MKRIYPQTDVRTGRTAYAVWEGEPDSRNPQRLLAPRLESVNSSIKKAKQSLPQGDADK